MRYPLDSRPSRFAIQVRKGAFYFGGCTAKGLEERSFSMAATFPNPFSLFDLGMSKTDITNLFSLLVDSFNLYVYPLDGTHSKQWLMGHLSWGRNAVNKTLFRQFLWNNKIIGPPTFPIHYLRLIVRPCLPPNNSLSQGMHFTGESMPAIEYFSIKVPLQVFREQKSL